MGDDPNLFCTTSWCMDSGTWRMLSCSTNRTNIASQNAVVFLLCKFNAEIQAEQVWWLRPYLARNWIVRFKNIVRDRPFLSNGQRLAYLQDAVTECAKAEIQFLGENVMNYALALRMLKSSFADAGRIVGAAITTLKVLIYPTKNYHVGLINVYEALSSSVVVLNRISASQQNRSAFYD